MTRYLVASADAVTLAVLGWGIGSLCALPAALVLGVRWPRRGDWAGVIGLGVRYFGVSFVFYNIAIGQATAARANLALSTLPLRTMAVGAELGIERRVDHDRRGAVHGVLRVWSRPFMQRSSPLGSLTVGAGAVALVAIVALSGRATGLWAFSAQP